MILYSQWVECDPLFLEDWTRRYQLVASLISTSRLHRRDLSKASQYVPSFIDYHSFKQDYFSKTIFEALHITVPWLDALHVHTSPCSHVKFHCLPQSTHHEELLGTKGSVTSLRACCAPRLQQFLCRKTNCFICWS